MIFVQVMTQIAKGYFKGLGGRRPRVFSTDWGYGMCFEKLRAGMA